MALPNANKIRDEFGFEDGRDTKRLDPQDIPVQLNVRIPWHYREQLIAEAAALGVSLNRYVTNALVREHPPIRR